MEDKELSKHQAHGMTVGAMRDLHEKQIHEPDSIKMIPGNNAGDKITDPYFAKDYADYELPVHEIGFYHVAAEARQFLSGGAVPVRTSVPAVHKLSKESYAFQKQHKAFDGQIVHILHNPELEVVKEKKKGKVEDSSDTGGTDDFTKMTVDELKGLYQDVVGTVAPKGIKKNEMIGDIQKALKAKNK